MIYNILLILFSESSTNTPGCEFFKLIALNMATGVLIMKSRRTVDCIKTVNSLAAIMVVCGRVHLRIHILLSLQAQTRN